MLCFRNNIFSMGFFKIFKPIVLPLKRRRDIFRLLRAARKPDIKIVVGASDIFDTGRKVKMQIMTNSLASTDEPTVHIGREATGMDRRGEESDRAAVQPSAVDCELNPYKGEIHDFGMVELPTVAEAPSFWDRTVEFARNVADQVKTWWEDVRSRWQDAVQQHPS